MILIKVVLYPRSESKFNFDLFEKKTPTGRQNVGRTARQTNTISESFYGNMSVHKKISSKLKIERAVDRNKLPWMTAMIEQKTMGESWFYCLNILLYCESILNHSQNYLKYYG